MAGLMEGLRMGDDLARRRRILGGKRLINNGWASNRQLIRSTDSCRTENRSCNIQTTNAFLLLFWSQIELWMLLLLS